MNPAQASAAFQARQGQLLGQTYRKAWQKGAASYRSQQATPVQGKQPAKPPPKQPSPTLMKRALAPALTSLAHMGAQIALLDPTDPAKALRAYLLANGWRLAGGISAAWAAEQTGFAEAANADGMLLAWQLGGAHPCGDCIALSGLPAMSLDQWPTMPGDGATECNVGCRCSMSAVAAAAPVLDSAQLGVLSRIGGQVLPVAA